MQNIACVALVSVESGSVLEGVYAVLYRA